MRSRCFEMFLVCQLGFSLWIGGSGGVAASSSVGPEIRVNQGTTVVNSGSTYTFPNTTTGVALDRTFTITNEGNATLTLSGTSVSGGPNLSLVSSPPPSLGPGGTGTFRVRLWGHGPGLKTGVVSMNTNDSNENPYSFTVRGTIVGPDIEVRQGSSVIPLQGTYSFPNTTAGASVTKSFTVRNLGNANLSLSNFSVSGLGWSATQTPPSSVAPGESASFTVRLLSTTAGVRTGSVTFNTNDSNENPYPFTLRGTVVAPGVRVTEGSSEIGVGSSYTFPTTGTGVIRDRTFTVHNDGTASLSLSQFLVSGSGFSSLTSPFSTVAPGGSTTFKVRLFSHQPGLKQGAVSFHTNDLTKSLYSFSLRGTVSGPEIRITQGSSTISSGATFSFPGTDTGVEVTRSFTVHNDGNANLTLSGVSSSGSSNFSLSFFPPPTISPGGAGGFSVRLWGHGPGPRTGQILLSTNDSNESQFSITVVGTIFGPEITVRQSSSIVPLNGTFTVPETATGVTRRTDFIVENTGNEPLSLGPLIVTGEGWTGPILPPPTIPAGGTGSFRVNLRSHDIGLRTGSVSLTTNDSNENPYRFDVEGMVVGPDLRVAHGGEAVLPGSTFVFPDTPAGGVESRKFTIFNDGNATLNVNSLSVTGPGWSVLSAPPSSIEPGANGSFRIRFSSTEIGVKTGHVVFNSNDLDETPFSFGVRGTIVAPDLRITQGGTSIGAGSIVDFPATPTGAAISKAFTLHNDGNLALNVSGVSLAGDPVFVVKTPPPPVIPVGSSADFVLEFIGHGPGLRTAQVLVSSDDPEEGSFSFGVKGTLVGPDIALTKGATSIPLGGIFDYPDLNTGEPRTRKFTVTNHGNAVLSIGSVTVSGAGWTLSTLPDSEVDPGSSSTFRIRFRSYDPGVHTGTVVVRSNDTNEDPYEFTVRVVTSGNASEFVSQGVPPQLLPGESRRVSIVARNSGTTAWSGDEGYGLASQSPADNLNWGFNRVFLDPGEVVLPGGVKTFEFDITAPNTSGSIGFRWRMIQEGVGAFGPLFPRETVQVGLPDLRVWRGSSSIDSGSTFVFPATSLTTPQAVTFSVTNAGDIDLSIENASMTGAGWSLTQHPPGTLTPGATESFRIRFDPSESGTHTGSFSFESNDPDHPRFLLGTRISVESAIPRLTSVLPQKIDVGTIATVTLEGENLEGREFYIPEYDGTLRTAPTLLSAQVSNGGRLAIVQIDATRADNEGGWVIAAQAAGETDQNRVAAIDFRVVGEAPVVDAWTPSNPLSGGMTALMISGSNLQGATVFANHPQVVISELDNSEDDALCGFLRVGPNVNPQTISLTVDNGRGRVVLEPEIVDPFSLPTSHRMICNQPPIYLQEMTYRADEEPGLDRSVSPCFFTHTRVSFRRSYTLTINLLDELGVPDPGVLAGLLPGEVRRFGVLTVVLAAQVSVRASFRFCSRLEFQFCAAGSIGISIPGISGFVTSFSCCFPGGCSIPQTTASSGEVTDVEVRTTPAGIECLDLNPVTSPADGGQQYLDLLLTDCCPQPVPILLNMQASLFPQTVLSTTLNVNNLVIAQAGVCGGGNPVFASDETDGAFLEAFGDTTGDQVAPLDKFRFLVNASRTITVHYPPAQTASHTINVVSRSGGVPATPSSGSFDAAGNFSFIGFGDRGNRPDGVDAIPPIGYDLVIRNLGGTVVNQVAIVQDKTDRMRQEYLDAVIHHGQGFLRSATGLENNAPPRAQVGVAPSREVGGPGPIAGCRDWSNPNYRVNGVGVIWDQGFTEVVADVRNMMLPDSVCLHSGHRSPTHNRRVPGSALSSNHQWGKAADLSYSNGQADVIEYMVRLYRAALASTTGEVLLERGGTTLLPERWDPPGANHVFAPVLGNPMWSVTVDDDDGDGLPDTVTQAVPANIPIVVGLDYDGGGAANPNFTVVDVDNDGLISAGDLLHFQWRTPAPQSLADYFDDASHVHASAP